MESVVQDPILREAIARLVRGFQPSRIYLFGSRAWGTPGPHSDYDLLVVVPNDVDEYEAAGRMALAMWGLAASFDIVARTESWWRQWSDTPLSLEEQIANTGIVLHDAA